MHIIHFFLKSIENGGHNELDSGFLPSAIMCSATLRAQRWHRLPTHTTKSTEAHTLSGSTHCTLTVSPRVSPLDFFFLFLLDLRIFSLWQQQGVVAAVYSCVQDSN